VGNQIGDPLYTPDAPKLIAHSEIKVAFQPGPDPYPQIARDNGVQGEVLLEVWIDQAGSPTKAKALVGPRELSSYAEVYVMKWIFKPYSTAQQPIPVRFRMVMPFKLMTDNAAPYRRLPEALRKL
jgi:TonB family protein